MQKNLANWSWNEIILSHQLFKEQLNEYAETALRFGMVLPTDVTPGEIIETESPERLSLVSRFYFGVNRINLQLDVLDREVARRRQLIGVVG